MTSMPTSVPKPLLLVGGIAVVFYLLWGLVFGLMPSHWEESGVMDQVLFLVLMIGGSLLLGVGLWVFSRAPWLGALLISLGGILGALPVFWMLLPLVVAVALVMLSIVYARRHTGAGRFSPSP